MRIILLRNAKHIGEINKTVFATRELGLTPEGKNEALLTCEKLATVYCSDFLRFIETIEP